MLLIRDVFRCKPGKSRELAEKLKATVPLLEKADGFVNCRVTVDLVGDYWTVVLESEAADLSQLERHLREYSSRPEMREVMAGYMDLVDGGHREIHRIV